MKNTSVKGEQMLLFMYTIVSRGVNMAAKLTINDEKAQRDYGARPEAETYKRTKQQYKEMTYKVDMIWKKGNTSFIDKKTEEISGRVLASFGL